MILLLALGLQPVVMVPEVMLENRPRVFYIRQALKYTVVPPIIPFETFIAVLGGHINFEFIFSYTENER